MYTPIHAQTKTSAAEGESDARALGSNRADPDVRLIIIYAAVTAALAGRNMALAFDS